MADSDNNVDIPALEVIQSLLKQGRFGEAAVLCEQACREPDADARVWHILGAIHGQNNEVEQAEFCTRQALAINPQLVSAYHNLAILLQRQGKFDEAEYYLRQALKLQPSDATLHFELGNIRKQTGRNHQAVSSYREAIRLAPGLRDAHFNLGNTYLDLMDLHSALGCMRASYACDSRFVKARATEANILEMQGDIEGAWRCLEQWLDREKVEPVFADAFASVSKHLGKEQQAIDCLKRVVVDDETPGEELSGLYHRMGYLQERLQQYDEAFHSYHLANTLADVPDNSENFIHGMRESRRVFTKDVMAAVTRPATAGEALVYIVGMPRSGTSLVEQILSAHTRLVAGGELGYLSQLSREVMPLLSAQEDDAGAVDLQAMEHHARRHMDIMRANFGTAQRITDKTPHNFKHLGLVHLLFPGARIIHCRRSPLDTCISCYSKSFVGKELAYTNDLASLGTVYREYEALMNYWIKDLGIPVLEVPYEAVVDNTGLWARRIVEYCGLEWEESCLEFYNVKRQVRTASYNQVRQPVYRSSVRRWVHFDKHLQPLKDILGEAEINYQQYLQQGSGLLYARGEDDR